MRSSFSTDRKHPAIQVKLQLTSYPIKDEMTSYNRNTFNKISARDLTRNAQNLLWGSLAKTEKEPHAVRSCFFMNVIKPESGFGAIVVALFLGIAVLSSSSMAAFKDPDVQSALSAGDTAAALSTINTKLTTDQSSDDLYHALGAIQFQRQQFEAALPNLKRAVELRGKNWEAQSLLGRVYLQLGNIDAAEKLFFEQKGKTKDKKGLAELENGYGLTMMAKKNYSEADKAFRRAIANGGEKAEYRINLGDANFAQGIATLAMAEYEKALSVDKTGSSEVYFRWAESCIENKDYGCAIEKLKIVLDKDSTYAPAWKRAGEIYFKASVGARNSDDRSARSKDVIGAYNRYFKLTGAKADSLSVRPYFEMGMAYANIRAFDSAAFYLNTVLQIPYEPRDVYYTYGKALWGNREWDSAAVYFAKHLEWVTRQDDRYVSTINMPEFYQMYGDAYYFREPRDNAKAIELYNKALETQPDNKRVLERIAFAYHQSKDYAPAIAAYEKRIALGIDSASSSTLKNAGFCALAVATGGKEESEDSAPSDSTTEEKGGNGDAASGIDPSKNYRAVAIEYFKKYLEYTPKDSRVLLLVAQTYMSHMKDCGEATKWFDRLLAVDPSNCDALKSLGFAYTAGNGCPKNYGRSLDYLLKAVECQRKNSKGCDGKLLLAIAQAYHLRAADLSASDAAASKSDYKNAYDWYGKVLECEPKNSDAKKGQQDTRFEF